MFENKKNTEMQQWCGQTIRFDPDSSPTAWEYFKKVYSHNEYLSKHYDFSNLFFYNEYRNFGLKCGFFNGKVWLNYVNKPLKNNYNRLYILQKGTQTISKNGTEYIIASNRLGGDCDFNFNDKKCNLFTEIIKTDNTSSEREKTEATIQLARCKDMHHRCLNFSLIQALGNLQYCKGSDLLDRHDTFIYALDKYYRDRGISNAILRFSSPNNEPALISFLNDFKDIYEYCAAFYFITDKRFVDEIIKQGSQPITNVKELVRYMNLAKEYWSEKEKNITLMPDIDLLYLSE